MNSDASGRRSTAGIDFLLEPKSGASAQLAHRLRQMLAMLLFLTPLVLAAPAGFAQGLKMTALIAPNNVGGTFPLGLNTSGIVVGTYGNGSGATLGFYYANSKFTVLTYGGEGYTRGSGINDSNTIVGDFLGSDGIYHGYTYINGVYEQYDVGIENSVTTSLFGINNAGDFVGGWTPHETGEEEGFVSIGGRGGKVTSFYASGTDATYAYAIDSADNTVGAYIDTSNVTHGFYRTAAGIISTIDYPGAIATVCYGINDSGVVSGTLTNSKGLPYGFLYTVKSKSFVMLDFAGTRGINSKGDYAGFYWGIDGAATGYLAIPQTFSLTAVQIPNSLQGGLNGVNNANVAVGSYVDAKGNPHGLQATLTSVKNIDDPKGVSTVCVAINSSNTIVGAYTDTTGAAHGFEYSAGKFTDIPGPANAVNTSATGINNAGVIVGDFTGTDNLQHAFVLKNGEYTQLDVPGSLVTFAGGINTAGVITLFWVDTTGYIQSSLYNGSTYTSINVPGAAETIAQGINTAGDVVFIWQDPYGIKHAALKKGSDYFVFDEPKGFNAGAVGINDSNLIVGSYTPTGKTLPEPYYGTE